MLLDGYTVKELLITFGRSVDTKLPDVESMSWEELFRMNNQKLQKIGMEPTERRYVHLHVLVRFSFDSRS